jgi:hypothetical protein
MHHTRCNDRCMLRGPRSGITWMNGNRTICNERGV